MEEMKRWNRSGLLNLDVLDRKVAGQQGEEGGRTRYRRG